MRRMFQVIGLVVFAGIVSAGTMMAEGGNEEAAVEPEYEMVRYYMTTLSKQDTNLGELFSL